ncbi:MAG: flavin reductase family protein [Roseiflexaceae bacterium]
MDTAIPFDDARFRQAMGHFASGVTVVTTAVGNDLYGMTVSSFSSLSLNPPLILICIDKSVPSHDILKDTSRFVVNILEERQEHLSRRFATSASDKFKGVAWHSGKLGLPVLNNTLAAIECSLRDTLDGGDHTIFVGEVVDAEVREGAPLLYYRRGYHELK